MVTPTDLAVTSPAPPSRLPELLGQARTPLDVLCALAEDGATSDLDLWALAAMRDGQPHVYLCTVAPLPPAAAASQLAHFASAAAAMDCEGDLLMPDWAAAAQQALCLRPQLPPVDGQLAAYRDTHIRTDEQTGIIIRAAAMAQVEGGREPRWQRLPLMVQYIRPYLRALNLSNADTARGMVDVESGTYSWPYFVDAVDREVERARRHDAELSVAVLELKPQRVLGEVPAELHRRIAEHIMSCVRRSDLVGRTGKRSYAVFFHGTGPRAALIAAGRIAEALAADAEIDGFMSFSLGVSGWDGSGPVEVSTLLAQAGEAAGEAATIAPGCAFVYV